jgi:hypothetical protein
MSRGNSFPNSFFSRNIGSAAPAGLTTGNVYWVSSTATGASDGNDGLTPASARATLDSAIGLCTANNGDIIVCMENHAETITGAGGITADVAGITIIGLGRGAQRPRFLMDGATTVTFVVSAADVTVENLVFASGHADVVRCFNITAANCTLKDIEFDDNVADENWLVCIGCTSTTDENASGLSVIGCKYHTVDTAATDFISIIADITDLTVTDNFYCADAATGAGLILCATTKDIRGLKFMRNVMICGNTTTDLMIDNDTTVNTGVAAFNLCGHHDVAAAIVFDCDGIRLFENYSTASDTAQGLLLPVADLDSA